MNSGPRDLTAHIDHHFGGDTKLFASFKAMCLVQFPHDVQTGDAACQALDAQALRQVAHSLKSVLLTLGEADLGELAKGIENSAHAGQLEKATDGWRMLRPALLALAAEPS